MYSDKNKELGNLKRSVRELSVLNEIAMAINISMSLDSITKIIIEKCVKQLMAEQGAIFLLSDKDKLSEDFRTFIRTRDGQSSDEPIHLNQSIRGWMIINKEILISNDLASDNRFTDKDILEKNIKSVIAVPLLIQGLLIGSMVIINKRDNSGFDENDKRFISILSAQVTNVIENARLHEREHRFISMVQNQRINAISKLVAGLAHELNNPIGAICGSVDIIKRTTLSQQQIIKAQEVETDGYHQKTDELLNKQMESVHVIESGSSRIANIVKRLKAFIQLDQSEFQEVDISCCVEDCLSMFASSLISRIKFVKDYGNIPKITCQVTQINQVIFNILLNSIEAMNEEGVITIKTYTQDDYVVLVITDSGMGIPKQHLGRVVDPGFTTKGVGVGAGLGLAICYQIIKAHKGELRFESEVDKYTKTEIVLPINIENINAQTDR